MVEDFCPLEGNSLFTVSFYHLLGCSLVLSSMIRIVVYYVTFIFLFELLKLQNTDKVNEMKKHGDSGKEERL